MEEEKQLELVTAAETLPAPHTVAELAQHLITSGHLDPQTGKQILELQIAWEKNESEKIFIQDFAELEFPPIARTKKSANSMYPPLEEIQAVVDPILRSKGFKLTFTSGEPNDKGQIPVHGILSHRLGHSRTTTIYQPIGAVSKGMNANQAMGSAISYGERYVAKMALNLRFIGLDDDAQSFSQLSEPERESINDLIAECGPAVIPKFLEFMGVKAVSDIVRGGYRPAINYLVAKRRQLGEKNK